MSTISFNVPLNPIHDWNFTLPSAKCLPTQWVCHATPLMLACLRGHGDVVDLLLETGSVDVDELSGVSMSLNQYSTIEGADEVMFITLRMVWALL